MEDKKVKLLVYATESERTRIKLARYPAGHEHDPVHAGQHHGAGLQRGGP